MTVFDFMASNADAHMAVHLIDDETVKLIAILTTTQNGGLAPTKYDNAEVLSWVSLSANNEYAVYVNYIED